MKELIILPPGPFTQKDHQRFGVEILKKYFSVKIIDCSAWIYKDHADLFSNEVYKSKEYISITSKSDFFNFLKEIKSPIVIDRLPINNKSNFIRKHLRKKSSFFVYLHLNLFPDVSHTKMTFNLEKVLKAILNPKSLFGVFVNLFHRQIFNLTKSSKDIFLAGGLASKSKLKGKNLIETHSMDYDVYLNIKNNPNSNQDDYAVFIDEDMVDHSDLFLLNLKPPATAENYYETLKKFLKNFELFSKLKVKIAFHPKRQKKIPNQLKEFEYTFGNTAEFVKNSKIVLAHSSTSISFAVLYNKPVIFLTSDEIEKSWQQSRIKKFSETLNGQLLNMNDDIKENLKVEKLFGIDDTKYRNYLNQYLKVPNSPDIPIWEIFCKKVI